MLGTAEILVILCIILLLFGGKKLPELARSLGKGIREFKTACQGITEDALPGAPKEQPPPASHTQNEMENTSTPSEGHDPRQ